MIRSLILILFAVIITSQCEIIAQSGYNRIQVYLKGVITDEITGKPVGVNIEFRDSQGEKVKIISNSLDGSYQQLVNAGEKYAIIFTNYDILRKTVEYKVPDTNSYAEFEMDYSVKKLVQGMDLFKYDAFPKGGNGVATQTLEKLQELNNLMVFNRAVNFNFVINAHDTFSKAPKPVVPEVKEEPKTKKSKKPKKVQVTVEQVPVVSDPDPQLVKELVDARIKSIETCISSWKTLQKRITIVADYSLAESPDESLPDFIISVKELQETMKQ